MSSGVNNDVWEEEQVARMLDLAGDEDDDGSGDSPPSPGPSRPLTEAADLRRPGPPPTCAPPRRHPGDTDNDRWSDITDPFEEFHFKGALQTEESQPTPALQPPGSRRSQFLRAVSLFSAAHQLAVLEAREEQGVSLLERSTSLTAEPLEPPEAVRETLREPLARSLSLPADHLMKQVKQSRTSTSSRSTRSTRSCSLAAEPCALPRPRPRRRGVPGPGPCRRQSTQGAAAKERAISRVSSLKTESASDRGGSGRDSETPDVTPRSPASFVSDPNMDPVLAELLRSLWEDPPLELRRSPRPEAAALSRGRDRDRDREPDVLSGLWRMLDSYDEFVCSPPGYNAFRQDKPHWLDQEPIPWPVREAAREKCNRWLQSCPIREWDRRDTLESLLGRRRSMAPPPAPQGPPPPRSVTSTPALADHVPAITAVRRLKQFKQAQ